jgi:hypothetical protein
MVRMGRSGALCPVYYKQHWNRKPAYKNSATGGHVLNELILAEYCKYNDDVCMYEVPDNKREKIRGHRFITGLRVRER